MLLGVALLLAGATPARAEDKLPPPPAHYFNDYAGVVPPEAAARMEAKLRAFDEQASSQIVVAVFPELPSPSLEDFTIRTAQSWRVGRKKLDNGVVLFVFVKDRKIRLEVGYGLEGSLPDATAKQIISGLMGPRFREGDYAGGIDAAVDAIIAATRGEYRAPPQVTARHTTPIRPWLFPLLIFFLFIVLPILRRGRNGQRTYHGRGWTSPWWYAAGGGWGSGGFSGGGSGRSSDNDSSGGGGFSGGGGSFGGGGASGDW